MALPGARYPRLGYAALMIPAAHLRVYEPALSMPSVPLVVGSVASPVVSGRYGLVAESMQEDGYHAEWRGESYLCPRTPRLRLLQGVLAVRRSYGQLGGSVIPEAIARQARRELAGLHAEYPGLKPHILTSAWHVPMRWFVPFPPQSRELLGEGDELRIRYRTDHISAIARLDQAIRILEESSVPEGVAVEVGELRNWVSEFGVESMLELDYAGVAGLFSNDALVMDDSAADIWAALEALEDGDWGEAGICYSRMVARWSVPMSVSYSN